HPARAKHGREPDAPGASRLGGPEHRSLPDHGRDLGSPRAPTWAARHPLEQPRPRERERGADRGSDPAAGSHRRRSVARRGRAPHGLRPDPIQSTIHGPGRAVPGTGRRAAARGLRPEPETPSERPGKPGRRRGRGADRHESRFLGHPGHRSRERNHGCGDRPRRPEERSHDRVDGGTCDRGRRHGRSRLRRRQDRDLPWADRERHVVEGRRQRLPRRGRPEPRGRTPVRRRAYNDADQSNRRGHAVPRRRHRVGSPTPQQRLITHPPDATRALGAAMKEIWVEKYRPKSLDEVVGQDEIVERLKAYAKEGNLPHLLFAGPAGTGKTTCAIALARDMFGETWRQNYYELNSSDERGIEKAEKLKITEDGMEALVYVSEGDMRRAVNSLQVPASLGATIDADVLYKVASTIRPEEVKKLIEKALEGEFLRAREVLDRLLIEYGLSGEDIVR